MNIAIIGTGYVGLVNGACLSDMGNTVTCIDINKEKIDSLNNGIIPIYEPGLEEIITRNIKNKNLFFTNDYSTVSNSDVIYITVGTPSDKDGQADLKYVFSAARDIAMNLSGYSIIVTKSTVPVGTTNRVREVIENVIKENNITGVDFDMVSNPEFLKEGSAIKDCLYPDRIVIGSDSVKAKEIMRNLYKPFTLDKDKIIMTNIESSEMIKYASNSMLATRISFMNEIANLCEAVGANVDDVRLGMGADQRIGSKFLYPGCGYGGSCFPKDVRALIKTGENNGITMSIIKAVEDVNERQKHILAKKIKEYFKNNLEGKTVAVWGLTFKPETDDMREAPSIVLINELLGLGVKVKAFNPVCMDSCKEVLGKDIYYAEDMYDAVIGADALVLVTEWNIFRTPDWGRVKDLMTGSLIIDGRNIYKKAGLEEFGFIYKCIG